MATKTFNVENRLLAGKLENPNYGTVQTLEDTDIDVRVRDLTLSSLTVEYDDESSKFATGDHTRDEAIAGITKGTFDFSVKIAPGEYPTANPTGTGTLGYSKYLKGAGLQETEVAGSGVIGPQWRYMPGTGGDLETLSMAIVDKESVSDPYGVEYKLAGAMSTLTIEAEGAGKPFIANFSYQGKVDGVYELSSAALGGDFSTGTIPTFEDANANSSIADKMLNTTISIDALNHDGTPVDATGNSKKFFCVNTASLDTGITIADVNCQSGATGILYDTITSRDPRLTINPLLERVGPAASGVVSADWFDFWSATNSEDTFNVNITSNHMELDIPRAQLISPNLGEDNGFTRISMVFRPLRNINYANLAGYESAEQDYSVVIQSVDQSTGV